MGSEPHPTCWNTNERRHRALFHSRRLRSSAVLSTATLSSVTRCQNSRRLAILVLPASSRPRRAHLRSRAQGRGRKRDGRCRCRRPPLVAGATSVSCRPRMRLPRVSSVILPSSHLTCFRLTVSLGGPSAYSVGGPESAMHATQSVKQVQYLPGRRSIAIHTRMGPGQCGPSGAENPAACA